MAIFNQVVSGGGSAPAHYIEKTVDANGKLVNRATSVIDLTGVTDIGDYVLHSAYYQNTTLTGSVNLRGMGACSGSYGCNSMFIENTGITSVDISDLKTVSGQFAFNNAFYGCSALTSVDLSSLTTVSSQYAFASAFVNCTNLTSFDLSSLTIFTGNSCFGSLLTGCTSLQTLSFPSLTPTSFGSNTTQFGRMLSGVTGCTVHFPSNIQSVIGSWASVTSGFSGINTTVLFDLPATVTLTGADTVTYTRNPKYDTATSLAWKVGAYGTTNFDTPYYTNGTTDPQTSDTIYSDSACTTAVTTISSIA